MSLEDRWNLYFHWLKERRRVLIHELINEQSTYRTKFNQLMEIKDMEDIQIMKEMLVLGMTTTGAARLQKTLMALGSPIVIVEEAAEVLEAHVTVSLTKNCQHLLLIGDHQQLRPSTSDYDMEHKYNLGISLFERMVKNKIDCHTLLVQHRMRPTISSLIVPAIYPQLQNASSVYNFPPIRGVASSIFFLDHNHLENTVNKTSKSNSHEAKFFIAFSVYLIECGYKPEDITILAAYSGQMLELGKERRKRLQFLKDVRITVLDNYQGEESKIILLSLTRNNKEGKIGFLKIENRVCVALSRAREGLYIMGNMNLLCRNSKIWPKVKLPLIQNNNLGTYLTLRCENRHEHTTNVRIAEDFKNIHGGICKKICNVLLSCRHKCEMVCHVVNREHRNVQCKVTVSERCVNNHSSSRLCFQMKKPCSVVMLKLLPCTHEHLIQCSVTNYQCPTMIQARLPCGHDVMKPCYYPISTFPCKEPCTRINKDCSLGIHACKLKCFEICQPCPVSLKKITIDCFHEVETKCSITATRKLCSRNCVQVLSCGHNCKEKCNESCTSECQEPIDNPHEVACGHKFMINCYLSKTRFESHDQNLLKYCDTPCETILSCSHKCSGTCGTCIQGRVHVLCVSQCDRYLICGHKCNNSCNEVHGFCTEDCSYRCKHSKCTNKCTEACVKCPEICERRCEHIQCTLPCGEICNVPPCSKLCPLMLPCGHPCIGFCGDPCPSLCRICHFNDVQNIHFKFNPNTLKRFVMLDECKHIIENDRMELWLSKNSNEIIYKSCPKCRVPLTSTHRYRHLIMKTKLEINDVLNNSSLHVDLYKYLDTDYLKKVSEILRSSLTGKRDIIFPRELLENKLIHVRLKTKSFHNFHDDLTKLKLLQDVIYSFKAVSLQKENMRNLAINNLNLLLQKLNVEYLTDQRVSNLYEESSRFFRLMQVLQIRNSNRYDYQRQYPTTKQVDEDINQLLYVTTPYTTQQDKELQKKIQILSKFVGADVINEEHRFLKSEIKMYKIRFFKCEYEHINVLFVNDDQLKKACCCKCGKSILSSSACNIL